MKKFTQALLATAIASTAAQANAIPYTFDFRQATIENVNAKSYSQGGVGLNVTAYATNNNGSVENRTVYAGPVGLGVYGSAWIGDANYDTTIDMDSHNVIGDYSNESLKFSFGSDVTLTSISFASWDIDDKVVAYELDGSGLHQIGKLGEGVEGSFGAATLNLNTLGNTFVISASDWKDWFGTTWHTTDVRITGLTINDNTPTQVPEPAGIALLGLGLAALGLSRRKQAKA